MSAGSSAVAALMVISGPFFPPSLLQPGLRADTRRCAVGTHVNQSDCALIGAQWVVTTARAVAGARLSGGHLHVRIGDTEYAVEQLVHHPKWDGGVRHDVTLLRLAKRVQAFPLRPLPGEFPTKLDCIARHAMSERQWVSATIGPSPVWDDRGITALAAKRWAFLTRVRTFMDAWSGRSTND
ncbi:MAG TPA: trypsin-like serine protease [Gemmatimonadaceae bacterium]|nr:trypsin-like serine protease [Gemmatimonadaceae bacterium]